MFLRDKNKLLRKFHVDGFILMASHMLWNSGRFSVCWCRTVKLEHVTLRHELRLSLTLERSRSVLCAVVFVQCHWISLVVTKKKNEHKCICSLLKGTSVWVALRHVLIDRDTCVCLLASLRKRSQNPNAMMTSACFMMQLRFNNSYTSLILYMNNL